MGRAGRGGGGGGSRGGGFGGSRGFGSHSGGSSHRSSFSSSHSSWGSSHHSSHHSSWGGSYHKSYNSGPRFYYFGSPRYSSNGYSGGYKDYARAATSCGSTIAKVMLWMFVIAIFIWAMTPAYSSDSGSITKSTVNRDKLESSSLVESKYYYYDELDWIDDPMTLKNGMQHFYEETGVQPFLYITDDVGGAPTDDTLETFANNVYDKYFEDEAHLVVVFYEKDGSYRSCYVTGIEAKTVIDDEAGEILLDYIDHYYYSDYDEATFFGKSFSEAADRIMRVTPSYGWIALIFILVIVFSLILFRWWKKKKQQKLDEMKQAQDILNSDLNEFSGSAYTGSSASSEVDELKKKYDN